MNGQSQWAPAKPAVKLPILPPYFSWRLPGTNGYAKSRL